GRGLVSILWLCLRLRSSIFFFSAAATTDIYALSLHDALPISAEGALASGSARRRSPSQAGWSRRLSFLCSASAPSSGAFSAPTRSEEHTSELQSRRDLVCRLLLEKKKRTRARAAGSDVSSRHF